jgi:hypothetical protein
MNNEAIFFSLGIVCTVVLAFAILGAYAFFKVAKLQKLIDQLESNVFDSAVPEILDQVSELTNHVAREDEDIRRKIDSRVDKLEAKLIPESAFKSNQRNND